jgi:hypothetical protein
LSEYSLNLAVSLANALAHKKDLEAKLDAQTKALKDVEARLAAPEARHTKDVATAEAKAAKAEKALAEGNPKQSKCEKAVIERVEALFVSFGSKFHPTLDFCLSYFVDFCANQNMLFMQQIKLERYTIFAKARVNTLYSTPLAF